MLSDPKNTLAFHGSRVLTVHRDMSHVPCSSVAVALSVSMKAEGVQGEYDDVSDKAPVPEAEAIQFYLMNHAMAWIGQDYAPLQPLPGKVSDFVNLYHTTMGPKAVRAMHYLLYICIREMRHAGQPKGEYVGKSPLQLYGGPFGNFMALIKSGSELDGVSKFTSGNLTPDMTIGDFTLCLARQFYECQYSGGFGGPKWGNIADCLHRFVMGVYTAEMMLDTIWTLAHNGGPIFNKGQLYQHYTASLTRVLDVQRAGLMPEAILHDGGQTHYSKGVRHFITEKMHERFVIPFLNLFEDRIGAYVDWYVVEALGGVGTYQNEKASQVEKHGASPAAAKAIEAKKKALKLAEDQAALKQAAFAKTHFEVAPGIVVKKVQRSKEAA